MNNYFLNYIHCLSLLLTLLQPNAQYQFSFDISDDESTNYHNRKEQRDGEKISGSYSVVDSDGFIRTVTYTADPEEVFMINKRVLPKRFFGFFKYST